jgi:hypothetical protein
MTYFLYLLPSLLLVVIVAMAVRGGRARAGVDDPRGDDELAVAPLPMSAGSSGLQNPVSNGLNLDYTQPFFAADGAHQDLVTLPRTPDHC